MNKTPPFDKNAEMSVLGAVFIDNEAIHTALDMISVDDFYQECHRLIFNGMVALSNRNVPIDLITLTSELTKKKEIGNAGGAGYLLELIDYTPTSANIAHYCQIVKDRSMNRQMVLIGNELSALGYDQADDGGELLESALVKMSVRHKSEPVTAPILVKEAAQRLKERHSNKGKITGVPYGFPDLDEATSGMHRGELVIVAGRPSMGKSAFAFNVAGNACDLGNHGMIFSLEMGRTDITDRMLSSIGAVQFHHLRTGALTEHEWPRYYRANTEIAGWNLTIDDTPGISLREIKSKARRQKRIGLDFIVVDYLQLMSVSNPKENRSQSIGELSRGLKLLARELDCTVVLLSQLSRKVEERNDKRPAMSDLRDSGEIEQDADVILFPYRPSAYCQQCRDRVDNSQHDLMAHQSVAEMIIEKQRNGERNISIPLMWAGEFQRFQSLANQLPDF